MYERDILVLCGCCSWADALGALTDFLVYDTCMLYPISGFANSMQLENVNRTVGK